jgi:hypothetical protein
MSLRPVFIHSEFHEMIDAFSVCVLGLGALTNPANLESLKPYKLVPVESSFSPEDSNIDLPHYLSRLSNEDIAGPLRLNTMKVLCQSLTISAFETLKASSHYTGIAADPVVQFFRHIRNAAAHNNVFTFSKDQPGKPAIWRGKQIARALEGLPCFFNFMAPGDLPLLLEEISRAL